MMEISGEAEVYYPKKVFKKLELPSKSMPGDFSMSRTSTLRSSAAKRKMTVLKAAETLRKSMPGSFSMSRTSTLRTSAAKRKMMEISGETVVYYTVAAVEVPKKTVLKAAEMPRKSMPENFSVSPAITLRSSAVKRNNELKNSFSWFSVTSSVDVGKKMMTRSAAVGFSAVSSSVFLADSQMLHPIKVVLLFSLVQQLASSDQLLIVI